MNRRKQCPEDSSYPILVGITSESSSARTTLACVWQKTIVNDQGMSNFTVGHQEEPN